MLTVMWPHTFSKVLPVLVFWGVWLLRYVFMCSSKISFVWFLPGFIIFVGSSRLCCCLYCLAFMICLVLLCLFWGVLCPASVCFYKLLVVMFIFPSYFGDAVCFFSGNLNAVPSVAAFFAAPRNLAAVFCEELS